MQPMMTTMMLMQMHAFMTELAKLMKQNRRAGTTANAVQGDPSLKRICPSG